MRDMLDLQVGDIIRLNERASSSMTLVIGKTPKFYAVPGLRGKSHAVQIVRPLDSNEK
jgi:flagellar motor switch protein FliM